MAGVNKVILVGNLGQDPESRTFSNGGEVVNLRIATSESWKDRDGNRQERTARLATRRRRDDPGSGHDTISGRAGARAALPHRAMGSSVAGGRSQHFVLTVYLRGWHGRTVSSGKSCREDRRDAPGLPETCLGVAEGSLG